MLRKSNRLLAAAHGFAQRGTPVTPAWPLIRYSAGRSRWRVRAAWHCGCGDESCASPGAHPLGPQQLLAAADVDEIWRSERPPNLLISPNECIAMWSVSREVGAYGMRLLEQQRIPIWPPVLRLPDGRWLFCTSSADQPHDAVYELGRRVRQLSPDSLGARVSNTPVGLRGG